jgi:hypothetical protein
MMPQKQGMLERKEKALLLVVLFFLVFLFQKIPVFGDLFFFFLVFFFIQFVGDKIEVNGVGLRHFELGLALWATQNLAFLDFVFIDIDFGGTFGAADHGSILRKGLPGSGVTRSASATVRVLYTACVKVNSYRPIGCPQRNLRLDSLQTHDFFA